MMPRFLAVLALALAIPVQQDVEQTSPGAKAPAVLVESFDGLGVGFEGPHGKSEGRNPSDNSLAVGPDQIVQTVNSRLAIFTKKGRKYKTTGTVLYGRFSFNAGGQWKTGMFTLTRG